ncbi:MAG: tRNA pseudouridine(38-40) synthase TruA [Chloroflexi bacterium]|nr:tRNA pseudouridine(38-40) synthase TruA [Chloroflexota bacterium]
MIDQGSTVANVKLVVEYDGTDFYGSQLQRGRRTVQAELEGALDRLTREKLRVVFAGRTDTGVHAVGQVVNFKTRAKYSAEVFARALNALLPKDIAVVESSFVPLSFNARFSARQREYRYYIHNSAVRSPLLRRTLLHVSQPLALGPMQEACRVLEGEQDFASFAGSLSKRGTVAVQAQRSDVQPKRGTVRRVFRADCAKVEKREDQRGDIIQVEIAADAFLPHMVRNIVGTLLWVGQGKIDVDDFRRILAARDRSLAGPTAPAHGLTLVKVDY